MTRRTRRNLSNPKIKRIVKKQILSSHNQISLAANSPFNALFKRVTLTIFVIFIVVWGYSLLKNLDLFESSFFENLTSSQNVADNSPKPNESNTKTGTEVAGTPETVQEEKVNIEPVTRKLQVEVLNGCGADGIASRVTRYLRDNEIDVVNIGNYSSFDVQKTVLWERVDKNEPAQRIAQLLGLSRNNIASKVDANLQLDVTIILGEDYKKLTPFKN